MDHEEREEIPWSSLMPATDRGVDRRWYGAVLVVGIGVIAFLAVRLFAAQDPSPPIVAPPPTTLEPTTTSTVQPELLVAESSLVAPQTDDRARAEVARAEWFVTDFFTSDGGVEREAIAEAVTPDLVQAVLAAHEARPEAETFVEWARVVEVEARSPDGAAIVVAYRAITATPDGYRRLPVAFVSLETRTSDGVPLVSTLPVAVAPWGSIPGS